jgi:hypothetical protein
MLRNFVITSFLTLGVVAVGVSMPNDSNAGSSVAFVGLWQAIDSFDGSTQFLSITCDSDNSCDVRLNDTAFTLSCSDQIGFARGVGSIDHDVLTVDLSLYCSNLDGTSSPAGSQENRFVLDRKNRTLININDDPVPVPNVFHRISQ